MSEEKRRILDMIQAGKITAAEGMDLLAALEEGEQKEVPAYLRVSRTVFYACG